jgi:RimJ/RimL family protein N-acetyltransferase
VRLDDLHTGLVSLRVLHANDLEPMLAARAVGTVPTQHDESTMRRGLERRIQRSGRFVEGRLDLGIEIGGRLVGTIEARQPIGALPPGVYEIGISLFDSADRGHGFGSVAVELLTRYLFSDPQTHRIQASTWVDNTAMRRVLEKLGFEFEGVMRSFMPTANAERQDYALYAVTRSNWRLSLGAR